MKELFKDKKFIGSIVFFILISIVSFFIDRKLLIDFLDKSNEITKIILESTVGFLGIWISCYFLAIQLYKNRYPMDLIKKEVTQQFNKFVSLLILCFAIGIIYLFVDTGIIVSAVYSTFCIICLLFISIKISATISDLSINNLFEKKIKDIDKCVDSNSVDSETIEEEFKKLSKLFNDSYNSSNYYMCEKIINELCESYNNLISNSSRILLADNEDNTANKVMDIYINFYKSKLFLTKDCSYNRLYMHIVASQEKNINATIKAQQKGLFEKYINELFKFSLILDDTSDTYEILMETIYDIAEQLIDSPDNLSYVKEIIDNVTNLVTSKSFQNNDFDFNTKNYYRFVLPLIIKTINNNITESYELLIEDLKETTRRLSFLGSSFEDSFAYFISYTNTLIKIKDIEKIKDYLSIYSYIEIPTSSDMRWVNYHLNFFDFLFTEFEELEKESTEIIGLLLRNLIANKTSFQDIVLPYYHIKKYYDSGRNISFSDFSKNLYLVMRAAVMNENSYVLSFYFDEINKYLIGLDKTNKKRQEELLGFYFSLITSTSDFSSKKIVSVIFYELENTIREIDSEHNISSELSETISNELMNSALYCMESNEFVVTKCIGMLYGFLEKNNETHFATANQNQIIKCIYNIGLNCIEYNQEPLLRQVSNAIGWITLNAIKTKQNIVFNYGISRAIDLYKLSKYMEITTKTKIFLMTLFTTIGAYCSDASKQYKYRSKIINAIIHEDFDIVKTATELRTKENNMWDSIMTDPQKSGEDFLKEFEKQQKENNK